MRRAKPTRKPSSHDIYLPKWVLRLGRDNDLAGREAEYATASLYVRLKSATRAARSGRDEVDARLLRRAREALASIRRGEVKGFRAERRAEAATALVFRVRERARARAEAREPHCPT